MEKQRHPMIEHYERIIEGYDVKRVAAKLQRFVDEAKALQQLGTPQREGKE